jgi:hypothetical protein
LFLGQPIAAPNSNPESKSVRSQLAWFFKDNKKRQLALYYLVGSYFKWELFEAKKVTPFIVLIQQILIFW